MPHPPPDATQLIEAALEGDEAARQKLFTVLHDELHRLAHAAMRRERPGHVLQTTALVSEAYLRLVEDRGRRWETRAHFFRIAAGAMRRILVDEARRRRVRRQVPATRLVSLADLSGDDGASAPGTDADGELVELERALTRLASDEGNRRKCQIVELRFFAGLTLEQTGEVLGVSKGTVKRDWRFTRAWLRNEIDGATGEGHAG